MELHRQWELLLEKMREKGIKLLQAQKLVQYLRECEDVMDWINDKVRFEKEGLLGRLLERMEVVPPHPPADLHAGAGVGRAAAGPLCLQLRSPWPVLICNSETQPL